MNEDLLYRISEGEGYHLDFKYAVTDSKKIARSLAAFANSQGGSLLLGVKDNGRIAGVNTDEEYYMIENAAHLYCKPEIKFSVVRWDINGKVVLEIVVAESKKKPHTAPDKEGKATTYIRVDDENIKVDRLHTLYLKQSTAKPHSVKIGNKHKQLIDLLSNEGKSSFNAVCKKQRLTSKEAEALILELLSIDIIGIESDSTGSRLFIKEE